MEENKPKNCWEYWGDSEEKRNNCPAYQQKGGKNCWQIAGDYCPKLKREFSYCWECPWFRQLNPTFDKIIKKAFNNSKV